MDDTDRYAEARSPVGGNVEQRAVEAAQQHTGNDHPAEKAESTLGSNPH